jgi:hypothetical protein
MGRPNSTYPRIDESPYGTLAPNCHHKDSCRQAMCQSDKVTSFDKTSDKRYGERYLIISSKYLESLYASPNMDHMDRSRIYTRRYIGPG